MPGASASKIDAANMPVHDASLPGDDLPDVQLNYRWREIVASNLSALLDSRLWSGTQAEVEDAQDNVVRLINALYAAMPGVGMIDAIIHLQQIEADGVGGGSALSDTYAIRGLNTVVRDDTGGVVQNGNAFQLPAGDYFLIAYAQAYRVNAHRLRWFNATQVLEEFIGLNTRSDLNDETPTYALLAGSFSADGVDEFELHHIAQTARSGDGLGQPIFLGESELYADVILLKLVT